MHSIDNAKNTFSVYFLCFHHSINHAKIQKKIFQKNLSAQEWGGGILDSTKRNLLRHTGGKLKWL